MVDHIHNHTALVPHGRILGTLLPNEKKMHLPKPKRRSLWPRSNLIKVHLLSQHKKVEILRVLNIWVLDILLLNVKIFL